MAISLYMDEHVHRSITIGLRLRSVDVVKVQEDGFRNTPDPLIMDRATTLGRVLFSQDDDMLVEAMRRQDTRRSTAVRVELLSTPIDRATHRPGRPPGRAGRAPILAPAAARSGRAGFPPRVLAA
ncbi:MAG: DUF5615 family PIN-like protein [Anaerolineales bacterium]|nr:DUF5615 family PIN-like protein [Anaerolineales bacterium]